MKIYQKVALILSITILAATTLAFLISEASQNEYLSKSEQAAIHQNKDVSRAAYEHIHQELQRHLDAWSSWDDLYQFSKKPTKEFIQKNINTTVLQKLKLQSVVIGDENGQILADVSIDLNEQKFKTPEKILNLAQSIYSKASRLEAIKDFIVVDQQIYLYQITKLTSNKLDSSDASSGFILIATILTPEKLESLKELTRLNLNISFNAIETESKFFHDHVRISVHFQSKNTPSGFQLEHEIPRSMYYLKHNLRHNFILILFLLFPASILFSIGVTTFFMKRPFDKLKLELQKVMDSNSDYIIPSHSRDEINDIESTVNELKLRNLKNAKDRDLQSSLSIQRSRLESLWVMAAGVAHEINNPLAIIRGKAESLHVKMRRNAEVTYLNELDKIIKTTDRIAKITDALKTISRNDENEAFMIYPLKNLIQQIFSLYEYQLSTRGIKLTLENLSNYSVECRPSQLQQVLVHLINNSIYEIKNDPSAWIKINVVEDEDFFNLEFSDSGAPLGNEIIDQMMQPFFTTKPVGVGAGLGLSICYAIVKSHKGDFFYDRQANHPTFIIRLPRAENIQQMVS